VPFKGVLLAGFLKPCATTEEWSAVREPVGAPWGCALTYRRVNMAVRRTAATV
jgi:hypothetical protein